MGKQNKRSDHVARKRHVWPVLIGSLLLLALLCGLVGAGFSIFVQTKLRNKLTACDDAVAVCTAALDAHFQSVQDRAEQYAKLFSQIGYAAGEGGSPALFKQLSDLERGADIGVILGKSGQAQGMGGASSLLLAEAYQRTVSEGPGVRAYPAENGGSCLLATALLSEDGGTERVLYIRTDSVIVPDPGMTAALSAVKACCVLDEGSRVVACINAVPAGFGYESIVTGGLLSTKGNPIGPRRLFRALGNGTISATSGVQADIWFERPLATEGWRALICAPVRIDTPALREAAVLLAIAALLLLLALFFCLRSVIARIVHNRQISQALLYDPLTRGRNFQFFLKESEKQVKRRRWRGKVFAFASMDVNRFRAFSYAHGHQAGETLLTKIYQHLERGLRPGELVARSGGDEFALLLILEPEEEPLSRMTRVSQGLGRLYPGEKISCSIGVYVVNDRKHPVESMYSYATVAKDASKNASSDAPTLFDNAMRDRMLNLQQVEALMEKALKNKEFVIYLQPKYNVHTRALSGAEALVRWISPEKGFVSPGEFIPIFESNGFIRKLDDYVLSCVCQILRRWLDEGRQTFPVSVNISRACFVEEHIAQHIKSIVDAAGVPYGLIELELTESAFFDDKRTLLNTVKLLRGYGFLVSMDDFGSGYSSLNSLKDLPLDVVKLDKAFFDDTLDVDRGVTLIRDTIVLAKHLDMHVVAEGIETQAQVDFLATTECDMIQGFYFGKPMPVEEFEKL